MSAAVAAPSVSGKLVVPPSDASPMVLAQIEQGQTIRKTRIRSMEDLDKARGRKGEWVTQTHAMLNGMFDNDLVAGDFNLCERRVLPDYAELHEFAEQFVDEMEQRLAKLRTIHRRIPATGPGATPARPVAKTSTPISSPEPACEPKLEQIASGDPRCLVIADADSAALIDVNRFLVTLGFTPLRVAFGQTVPDGVVAFAVFFVEAPPTHRLAFDLGFAAGRCGAGRVFLLSPRDVDWPADFEMPSIPFDATDLWQLHLARQLKRAGVNVDLNRLG